MPPINRRERIELAVDAVLVAAAALAYFLDWHAVLRFALAALAIAALARTVGASTEQLGGRLGAAGAGVVQSALGNLPELFIALFALNEGLIELVQASLIGSILANSILVLGLAFTVGGLRNGLQSFDAPRARIIATLAILAAAILSVPTFAHTFHTPAEPNEQTLEPDLRGDPARCLPADPPRPPAGAARGGGARAAALVASHDARRPRLDGGRRGARQRLVRERPSAGDRDPAHERKLRRAGRGGDRRQCGRERRRRPARRSRQAGLRDRRDFELVVAGGTR